MEMDWFTCCSVLTGIRHVFVGFTDELPVWGMVGQLLRPGRDTGSDSRLVIGGPAVETSAEQVLLYTHKSFSISYNQDRIIQVTNKTV